MGVPAFFRWLARKFPNIVAQVDENVDMGFSFDNVYLDMNGIIHPCTHPEYKKAPENEHEMFEAIFEYIDRLMKILKPKKLLYMAIDGVAPRAKMNQQRSRRFRAAKESIDKKNLIEKLKEELRNRGTLSEENQSKKSHFDSNVITPGTPFMINLSKALQTWIGKKLDHSKNDDELWHKDLVVILSDASFPGEGEHKIMEYIRRQKAQPTYDSKTSHCLCGADADLIMLGLATHELDFTIIREEFTPNQPKPCDICDQYDHKVEDCEGDARESDAPTEPPVIPQEPGFIFIKLNILRDYLAIEAGNLDVERFIDDFVFLCFFVGNDFLPHLPSLEIREGAIDRLLKLYKNTIEQGSSESPYLTDNGKVNLRIVQRILKELGHLEDDIFRRRRDGDKRYRNKLKVERQSKIKEAQRRKQDIEAGSPWLTPQIVVPRGEKPQPLDEPRKEAYNVRMMHAEKGSTSMLKYMLTEEGSEERRGIKRSSSDTPSESDTDSEIDEVMLGSEGWRERYYYHKFGALEALKISKIVAREYVLGLCWVLLYYYQGCPDWQWFYPFHYAPFASDLVNIVDMKIEFNKKSKPFKPLEQLMSVFPAESAQSLPISWRKLMMDPTSKIIDFYPKRFRVDMNGKMQEWQGVALLPFIDEERLQNALQSVYSDLDESEKERNSFGEHFLFVSIHNDPAKEYLNDLIDGKVSDLACDPTKFSGLNGKLGSCETSLKSAFRSFILLFKDPEISAD